MKTRVYRRVGTKHIKFNISKSGVSTSFKIGMLTINPQRNTYSINTPVKGLSLRGNLVNEKANNRVKLQGMDGFLPFFTELRKSLVSNELNNLIPYTDTLISECRNKKGVDISLFADTVEALEKGLRKCDVEVDEPIYGALKQIRETFSKYSQTADEGVTVAIITVIAAIILLIVFA